MCTAYSHSIFVGGTCLCGAIQGGHYCEARSLKDMDRYPPFSEELKKRFATTNEECCDDPHNCEKIDVER